LPFGTSHLDGASNLVKWGFALALSDIDRNLLQRCLTRKAKSWEDFVDRFLGLVTHVVNHTAQSRSVRLIPEDREDLSAEVFLAIIKDNFAVLRRFRGESSLATYLTVIARRVVVRELLKRNIASAVKVEAAATIPEPTSMEHRISDRDEVNRLLSELDGADAEIVRLYHLEGKSYQEISAQIGLAENSIGPTLSRARSKMRASADSAAR